MYHHNYSYLTNVQLYYEVLDFWKNKQAKRTEHSEYFRKFQIKSLRDISKMWWYSRDWGSSDMQSTYWFWQRNLSLSFNMTQTAKFADSTKAELQIQFFYFFRTFLSTRYVFVKYLTGRSEQIECATNKRLKTWWRCKL